MSTEVGKEVELYETLYDQAIGGFYVMVGVRAMNNVLLIPYDVVTSKKRAVHFHTISIRLVDRRYIAM